ncbi:ParB N-terminal domain-containing protein [Pectobacterium versatile]|uniref:ParB N-terminal domain-containing protein n=1 Tax=Pectobacterium versatile TaxID=2488639 RepID=UPI001F3CFC35|nr:ParB N-terminal domain-containing protein [Pectobacterium versatile]
MFESMTYQIALTPVQFLLPSENVDMSNVECLMEDICRCGCWTTPVPIEKETGIIMDGNHRLRAATELGLKHIPCALLDYDDPRVSVYHWKTGQPFCKSLIMRTIVAEKSLFPYKTTRHFFQPALPSVRVVLDELMR